MKYNSGPVLSSCISNHRFSPLATLTCFMARIPRVPLFRVHPRIRVPCGRYCTLLFPHLPVVLLLPPASPSLWLLLPLSHGLCSLPSLPANFLPPPLLCLRPFAVGLSRPYSRPRTSTTLTPASSSSLLARLPPPPLPPSVSLAPCPFGCPLLSFPCFSSLLSPHWSPPFPLPFLFSGTS